MQKKKRKANKIDEFLAFLTVHSARGEHDSSVHVANLTAQDMHMRN